MILFLDYYITSRVKCTGANKQCTLWTDLYSLIAYCDCDARILIICKRTSAPSYHEVVHLQHSLHNMHTFHNIILNSLCVRKMVPKEGSEWDGYHCISTTISAKWAPKVEAITLF